MASSLHDEDGALPHNGPTVPGSDPATALRRRWKGKERAGPDPGHAPAADREPLSFMQLPVEILRLIINEVGKEHTGKLFGLLLANSTLHDLVAPYYHAAYHVRWPPDRDSSDDDGDDTAGYDALSHGLSVLTLGSLYLPTVRRLQGLPPVRVGHYARFTRSFSVDRGPASLMATCKLHSRSIKMLNTLVALAIQKMANLESFTWDMPTGVSSEVFMALASLAHQTENRPCKLNHVWVRLHDSHPPESTSVTSSSSSSPSSSSSASPTLPPETDNVTASSAPPPYAATMLPPSHLGSSGLPTHSSWAEFFAPPVPPSTRARSRGLQVEFPTFSALPPLGSIAALDIDQVLYMDELALLIERSRPILKQLRLSVSSKAKNKDFVKIKGSQQTLYQYDPQARWPGASTIGDRRLGGVLGVVLARTYDLRKKHPHLVGNEQGRPSFATASEGPRDSSVAAGSSGRSCSQSGRRQASSSEAHSEPKVPTLPDSDDRLTLERLELCRIPLHTLLCVNALDWTVLTSLTILKCPRLDKLWVALRKQFRPTRATLPTGRAPGKRPSPRVIEYHLRLKAIHVDITSFSFMGFLKETLAPNSLEVLFLQDRRRRTSPPVPISDIFAGPIKRQHASLKKLLLDSSRSGKRLLARDHRRKYWALTSEMLLYVTSGRMSNLRELSVSLGQEQWHLLLQRLPNVAHLTALHIPGLSAHSGPMVVSEVEQHAQQIIDVITLRPEIQLRFLALQLTCFEIVECQYDPSGSGGRTGDMADDDGSNATSSPTSSSFSICSDDEVEPSVDSGGVESRAAGSISPDGTSSRRTSFGAPVAMYRLEEIWFYDDKVDIFRARHGSL